MMISRRTKNGNTGSVNTIVNGALMGTYVAVGLMMTMGSLLYVALLMNPKLLQHFLQDVMQCQDFGYFSSSPAAHYHALHDVDSSTYSPRPMRNELMGIRNPTDRKIQGTQPCACDSSEGEQSDSHLELREENESQVAFTTSASKPVERKLRLFIGILTMAWKVDRRHVLRLAYGVQYPDCLNDAEVTLRFVIGAVRGNADRTMVGMENATYGDMLALKIGENLNNGKTYHFFSSLSDLGVEYDYVMKTDDDSYVRVANLLQHLKPFPREDLYYGYHLPCDSDDPNVMFMAGAGYLLSWDLVLWIKESPIPKNQTDGLEDMLVASWFQEGGKAKNRRASNGKFYDHPDYPGVCAHELIQDTILVHKLKTPERWLQVLAFF